MFGPVDNFPDYNAPSMNPEHKRAIDENIARQDKDVSSAYDRGIQQAEAAKGLLPSRDNAFRSEAALGRSNKAQTDAILQKGQTLFSKNFQKMLLQHQLEKHKAQQSALTQKYQLSQRQWKIFEEIRLSKIQAEANKIAARNAVIGQVFQIAGTVAGGMVGGPMGAAAGSQIGGMMAPKQKVPNAGTSNKTRRTEAGNGYGDFNDRMYQNHGDENG
jgi:hypothetical protein